MKVSVLKYYIWVFWFILGSKSLLFNVVNIKPAVNDTTCRQKLLDVTFEEFLNIFRHVSQAFFAHLVVPLNDFDTRVRRGVSFDPGCACRTKDWNDSASMPANWKK